MNVVVFDPTFQVGVVEGENLRISCLITRHKRLISRSPVFYYVLLCALPVTASNFRIELQVGSCKVNLGIHLCTLDGCGDSRERKKESLG